MKGHWAFVLSKSAPEIQRSQKKREKQLRGEGIIHRLNETEGQLWIPHIATCRYSHILFAATGGPGRFHRIFGLFGSPPGTGGSQHATAQQVQEGPSPGNKDGSSKLVSAKECERQRQRNPESQYQEISCKLLHFQFRNAQKAMILTLC